MDTKIIWEGGRWAQTGMVLKVEYAFFKKIRLK